ncbi:MAG: cytochrome c maturation protein CcmE [Nitrospinota bacterium]|nr:cytochrome c maturation protein CcmE [Nitrospinota bacterium]
MTKAQKKFIVGASIIASGIGYLIFTAINISGVYYLTISEALAKGAELKNSDVRIEGHVAPGSVTRSLKDMYLTFAINDETGNSLNVDYHGIVPDGFKEEHKVIVEGRLTSDGAFTARSLTTPCASRYEAADDVKPHS